MAAANSTPDVSLVPDVVLLPEGVAPFIQINQNDSSGRKHIKHKEEDIPICECKYDANDPDSACGERCLNALTSTECIPGYCPCGDYCKNQRFQKSEYAKTRLFKTEGRGWGLLADEKITAGQFVIEYCGEVISSEEAKRRSQAYESQGLRDAYIISLNANYFIDATRKGSLARFINHSCQPNCETRKWTVLGETRVGIFAKQDISVGTELAYDYNFEWYGGANVRCLCGAPNCSIFLGAKSQGFQEHNHVWEDGDDRYTVDEFPLYDSAEDEPLSKLPKVNSFIQEPVLTGNGDYYEIMNGSLRFEHQLDLMTLGAESHFPGPVEGEAVNTVKTEVREESELPSQETPQAFPQTCAMGSETLGNSVPRDYNIGSGTGLKKKNNNRKPKHSGRKQVNAKRVAQLFSSKQAREEILKYEEIRSEATLKLDSLYDEIRPAIEEHERDSQDSVPTSLAEKWIEASCSKLKADFDLYFSIVKNSVCLPPRDSGESNPSEAAGGSTDNAANHSTA